MFVILSLIIFKTDCRNFFDSLCVNFPSDFSKELIGDSSVAVVVYEAFRQQPGFGGLSLEPTEHHGTLHSQYR